MSSPPTGTITFLFTDIEGSTKLWELHPEAMRVALARHDHLMRLAIEQQEGYVFKTIGDAFCAAFPTASDALNAALIAQQSLLTEDWTSPIRIKVRMALHTGAAEARDNDYFGPPLNRVARLLSAGYGTQILLSHVAQELIRDVLPADCSLLPLGEHRLRDLSRAEIVYQLLHPNLPAIFPALKSLDNPELPNNLPQQLTSFIGREKEITEVKTLLDKTRLLTLTGSGGCGKTRLSLQIAADLLDRFPDGTWLVELAPIADMSLVPQTIASVLGLSEQAGKSYIQLLTEHLKAKRLLLVLDNCEHVLSACSQLADTILRTCPHIKILASSREGLGIAGEQAYRVPSLSLPNPQEHLTITSVSAYEAMRLFIERALIHLPTFTVTNQNVPSLAAICRRLDGIPLAIELAAARVRSLSIEEINTRLDNRFRLLTGGSKTALPRQQTLRALIDWSYGLLNSQEKLLLCHLSVFAGGWTLAAAEAVGIGKIIEDWEVLDLLSSLADKSLVLVETRNETTRYNLLETVRQYARDRLVESESGLRVRECHRDYFLKLAEEIRPKLRGPEQGYWLSVLDEEHDNLRQALTFSAEDSEGGETGLRLGGALQRFWRTRGHLSEGRERLQAVLDHPGAKKHSLPRALSLNGAGTLALLQGDFAVGRIYLEECLAISRELDDKNGVATCLNSLGLIYSEQGDYMAARVAMEEALTIKRTLNDSWGIASSLSGLGNLAKGQGDYVRAQDLLQECLSLFRELGDRLGIAYTLGNLGNVVKEQGNYGMAYTMQEECLSLLQELGDTSGIAICLNSLGLIALDLGNYANARTYLQESLRTAQALGERETIASGLEGLASLAFLEQETDRASQLWGAAERLRQTIDSQLPPIVQEKYNQQAAQARSISGHSLFDSEWEKGRNMPFEQVLALALAQAK